MKTRRPQPRRQMYMRERKKISKPPQNLFSIQMDKCDAQFVCAAPHEQHARTPPMNNIRNRFHHNDQQRQLLSAEFIPTKKNA